MSVKISKRNWILAILSALLLAALFNSCEQYDYSSPVPGTLELRFRASYNNFDTLFALNNFALQITTITAVRSDGFPANVFQDVKSIGPSTTIYNVMGRDAYDSALVIGYYPLPPATYSGLSIVISPGPTVVLDGYRNIPVENPYNNTVPVSHRFEIVESKTTTLVLTVDLDVTLRKLAYTFQYDPRPPNYSITSVSVH